MGIQTICSLSLSQGGKKLGHMQKRVSARVGPFRWSARCGREAEAQRKQARRIVQKNVETDSTCCQHRQQLATLRVTGTMLEAMCE